MKKQVRSSRQNEYAGRFREYQAPSYEGGYYGEEKLTPSLLPDFLRQDELTDWLYTYLRTYYRDPSTATGWNNLRFPNVGMPHVLWQLQGTQVLQVSEKEEHGHKMEVRQLALEKPGQLSPKEYDLFVADLVNYLSYMAEPAKTQRTQLGIIVLFFLVLFFVVVLFLKKEYWKDIR